MKKLSGKNRQHFGKIDIQNANHSITVSQNSRFGIYMMAGEEAGGCSRSLLS
jgi:hypothetical protein